MRRGPAPCGAKGAKFSARTAPSEENVTKSSTATIAPTTQSCVPPASSPPRYLRAEARSAISAGDAAGRYYVQMGAAWALATFYLQLPQEVMRLLRTHPDAAVCRMAVRKLCESLRVPAGAKAQANQIWKERKGV